MINISDIQSNIIKPVFIISEQTARENIRRMKRKAERNNVLFRPHFKTHQSAEIAEWFREEGVHSITVSSIDLALYFAGNGWNDITISTPVNPLQIQSVNQLAGKITLNIVVDHIHTVIRLSEEIRFPLHVFLKIDTGNKRCGLNRAEIAEIFQVISLISQCPEMKFKGFLVHSGHTYSAASVENIREIYMQDKTLLTELKKETENHIQGNITLSIGDTPGCSVVEELNWADEIRPGNFIFYDLLQWQLGVCTAEHIAGVMACPVIGVYPGRSEALIYGGAVHFSKDSMIFNEHQIYGILAKPESTGILQINEKGLLVKLWQEHGLVRMPEEEIRKMKPGDIVYICPVHSCLTLDAVRNVITTEGKSFKMMLKQSISANGPPVGE